MFAGITDWSASYWVYFSAKNYSRRWAYFADVWENVWIHLNNAGVEFAFKEREREESRRDAGGEAPRAILEKTEIFKAFTEETKSTLSNRLHRFEIPSGGVVIREGMAGGSLFIIAEGVVGMWSELEDGESVEVSRRGAGSIIGATPLLTGETREATVKAITDVVLYEIKRDDITPLLESEPDILVRLRKMQSERKIEKRVVKEEKIIEKEKEEASQGAFFHKPRRLFSSKRA